MWRQEMQITTIEHVRSASSREQIPLLRRGQVAFVGRSNVGKSSLLNRLVGRRRLARTSSTPGRTRQLHLYLVDGRFYLVDLPGYGYAKRSHAERRRWSELIEEYFRLAGGDVIGVQLVDAKVGATDLDLEAAEYLKALAVPSVVAATKLDRVPRSRRDEALRSVRDRLELNRDRPLIGVSARTGEGIQELWKELTRWLDAAA